ncbi:hypothetical protein M3O96_12415 [Aquiflexum sp. TKW24L]|uniref:hypothetical protein n=1 Tax=Aquiflexum sp. TKW24L TaxID=2942212 RepID=UPI0020C12760|nr:hypothetical protein [Aquiflexum sp. TKW24L]MCL6259899.1 hypothetical protein [Aquiflexum sp. TKW24L]
MEQTDGSMLDKICFFAIPFLGNGGYSPFCDVARLEVFWPKIKLIGIRLIFEKIGWRRLVLTFGINIRKQY